MYIPQKCIRRACSLIPGHVHHLSPFPLIFFPQIARMASENVFNNKQE